MMPPPPLLFRFGKHDRLEQTLTKGTVRFYHASTFKDSTLAAAQQDDEQSRLFHLNPIVSLRQDLVGRTGRPLDYYIFLPFAGVRQQFLRRVFGGTPRLRIRDPGEFSRRLEKVMPSPISWSPSRFLRQGLLLLQSMLAAADH